MATNVFLELFFKDGKLANYNAKEGYGALLKRHRVNSRARQGIRNLLRQKAILANCCGKLFHWAKSSICNCYQL